MNKGLEALNAFERICEHIRQIDYDKENIKYYDTLDFIRDVNIVKEQLLQKTKNIANNSCKNKNEAVENLKKQFEILGIKENPYLKIIEQELKEYEQHKAVEQELGIDLVILFKALKHGIYVKNRKNEIRRVSCNIGLVETGGHNSLGLRFQDTNYKWRYLVLDTRRDNDVEDYGKTWALTKEELL